MDWSLWANVTKSEDFVVFVDNICRNFLVNDFAEKTIGGHTGFQ